MKAGKADLKPKMTDHGTAARYITPEASLGELRQTAETCTACDLYRDATQTVFGEGPLGATVMLIGEQPGDSEDREGLPFVGPAGRLLDRALEKAGIDRKQVYVTNVVKHFKWVLRGKKRLHQKPQTIEIRACLPWLEAEIDRIAPDLVIFLGATASQALLGKSFRVTEQRGKLIPSNLAAQVFATVHPSSLLRLPSGEDRATAFDRFVGDLRTATQSVRKGRTA